MSLVESVQVTPPGPVHVPRPDDREPKTRLKTQLWDRVKIIVIIAVIFGFLVAKQKADVPIMPLGEAIADQLRSKWWLVALAGIEALRQIHYLIAEHSAAYNQFWEQHIWGAWNRRVDKMNPWLRYRINRVWRFAIITTIAVFILAALWGVPPLTALAEAPSRLWDLAFGPLQGMPALIYILFFVGMAMVQFAAIFWFMSRGGVDTYMPNEVKTRFDDVWGQDHVLEKVRENVALLERPEEIENKGGHVPSGILLWGPPGTGKTLMAEAVAGETGRPYVFVDPGAFQNMFFGVGILKVKSLFRKLRKLALRYGGVIVFFDEADSLGSRGGAVAEGAVDHHAHELFGQTCNGLGYLSAGAQHELFQQQLASASPEPEGKQRIRDRVVMAPGMGGGGGGMGTLQALLTELSGLTKPRGFFSRRLRQFLNMKPKQPPKYRILVMMATNMPDTLDSALLRPGRIDRIYKVGYPSKEGRKRTYWGYLNKIKHSLTDANVDKMAVMTPYATGASIKDTVNESLLVAMREGRDTVEYTDLLKAKHNRELGPAEGFEYIERERHAVAIHEACHAVSAYRVRMHFTIDLATIERRGDVGGFVSSIPPEDRFTHWRSEHEADIVVSLASLAGERMFFGQDNSSGVGGDLHGATSLAMAMQAFWGMGPTVSSRAATLVARQGITARPEDGTDRNVYETSFGRQVEAQLQVLFERAERILEADRRYVFAVAHTLETHQTITGEDVEAIFKGTKGPIVDGGQYATDEFMVSFEAYHLAAAEAHRRHAAVLTPLPVLRSATPPVEVGNGIHVAAHDGRSPWAPPIVPGKGNGTGNGRP